MPHEIEIKILEIDRSIIEHKLKNANAILHFSGEMAAVFFDNDHNDLAANGSVLRLRKEGNVTVCALKQKTHIQTDAKIMDETEVRVSDFEAMRKILKGAGFTEKRFTRKTRDEYVMTNHVKVVLDKYMDELAHIPLFLEIEAPDLESLYQTVSLLGFTREDCKNWSTYELAEYYSQWI